MRKCPHCHEEVSSNARFCNHCGKNISSNEEQHVQEDLTSSEEKQSEENTPVEHEEASEETHEEHAEEPTSTPPVEQEQELVEAEQTEEIVAQEGVSATSEETVTTVETSAAAPVTPKSNKNKWYIGIVAIIAVLGIGLYALGKSLTSETHLINNFEQAVEDGDTKALKELLESDDKNMEITDEGLEAFVALYDDNQSELKQVVDHLKREAKGSFSSHSMHPVNIHKDGKKWLVFDDYKLVVRPVYFDVSTNYKDTAIYLGDEEVAVSDKEYFDTEIGPFMPGEYTLRAVHDNGFSNLDIEEIVSHSDPEFTEYVNLHIDGSAVYFTFDEYNYNELNSIKLYINGKETDYDLIDDNYVEPLLTDGSMNASFEAELPWGTILTEEVPIDSTDVVVNFAQNEEFQEEIIDIIMDFNEEFIKFYAELDANDLTTVSIELAELLVEESTINLDSGLEYKGAFHGAEFYLDSFNLSQEYNDVWYVEVDGIVYTEEAIYEDGEDEPMEQLEDERRFILGYDQSSKEWIVSGMDYASWMDEDDLERFTVENPETYTSNWNSKKDKKDKKDKD